MLRRLSLTLFAFVCIITSFASAHVFPDHSLPRVGSTVAVPPTSVRIWFDGELEPLFSTVRVTDEHGARVDSSNARVDPNDPTLLRVGLLPLQPGAYHVYWVAVSRDGHRTQGGYTFTIVKSANH
jgi:copper resistance protein C